MVYREHTYVIHCCVLVHEFAWKLCCRSHVYEAQSLSEEGAVKGNRWVLSCFKTRYRSGCKLRPSGSTSSFFKTTRAETEVALHRKLTVSASELWSTFQRLASARLCIFTAPSWQMSCKTTLLKTHSQTYGAIVTPNATLRSSEVCISNPYIEMESIFIIEIKWMPDVFKTNLVQTSISF